ncbi:class I SAM-dependent methyltransferase [Levilactobacillus brevis]|uniref:class I SAM-dependent methyltransferase n=1 Tax=Levilactobacillus brevis TaxID=1580 RepID=UPI0032E0881A
MKKVRENGIDGFGGLVSFIGLAVACFIIWLATGLATSWLIATLLYVAMASCFLYTTLIGKQKIWDQQLPQITLSTDTRALDIGCGHGMVLFKIAHRLPAGGHITGIDIWRQQDQTNNNVVVSSLAIHNVKPKAGRQQSLREIARVLQPGGQLVIADLGFSCNAYRQELTRLGFHDIQVTGTGINGWWGGPWMPTLVLRAIR